MEIKLSQVNCNYCGSTKYKKLVSGFDRIHESTPDVETDFVRCEDCDNLYLNPVINKANLHVFYPEDYYTSRQDSNPTKFSFKDHLYYSVAVHKFDYLVDLIPQRNGKQCKIFGKFITTIFYIMRRPYYIRRILPYIQNGNLLEFGYGSGWFLKRMNSLGWNCFGIEKSLNGHHNLEKDGIYIDTDFRKFNNGLLFDVIYAYHSLEHEYKPLKLLKQFRDLIHPKGTLIIGVPNQSGLLARVFGPYWDNLGIPIHLTLFNTNTMEMFLREAGFKIVCIRHSSHSESISGSMQWWFNHILSKIFNKRYHSNRIRNNKTLNLLLTPLIRILDSLRLGDCVEYVATPR